MMNGRFEFIVVSWVLFGKINVNRRK